MKHLKIGVTIALKTGAESIWTNGIRLNTMILAAMLQNSARGYSVTLLNIFGAPVQQRPPYLAGFEFHPFIEKFREMDLIITIGGIVDQSFLDEFKASGPHKRIVSYRCGNDYLLLAESVLFQNSATTPYPVESAVDEVWYVPQQHETNSGFLRTLHRANSLIVPFVWSDRFLRETMAEIHAGYQSGKFKRDVHYTPRAKKGIGILEPNLNLVKFGLLPLMIAEECYRGSIGRECIDYVMLTNAQKLATHKQFMDVVRTFDLFADKKVFAEARYQIAFLLTQHADVLICHQVLNPLNYLYLDAAYMGFPVLHNAPLVRDLGYYYEGSDTLGGARQLDYILTEHDSHLDEYRARNQAVLQRYSADNPDLIATYDRLIERLFSGEGNDHLVYRPETNLYANG